MRNPGSANKPTTPSPGTLILAFSPDGIDNFEDKENHSHNPGDEFRRCVINGFKTTEKSV